MSSKWSYIYYHWSFVVLLVSLGFQCWHYCLLSIELCRVVGHCCASFQCGTYMRPYLAKWNPYVEYFKGKLAHIEASRDKSIPERLDLPGAVDSLWATIPCEISSLFYSMGMWWQSGSWLTYNMSPLNVNRQDLRNIIKC